MKQETTISALLVCLADDLARELIGPLKSCAVNIISGKRTKDLKEAQADIIFCGADVDLIQELHSKRPESPIVVVSRHPEVSGWLDSIEAGASDYCAAPFDPAQIRWILDTSVRYAPALA